jgi:hypothetical protein
MKRSYPHGHKPDVFRRGANEGFQGNGAVVLRDRRGTRKAEIPDVDSKGFSGGDDPLAITSRPAPLAAPAKLTPRGSYQTCRSGGNHHCLDCGYKGQMLKRHLTTAHGLTADEYRNRWSLPRDYPMVARSYLALAKAVGLGMRDRSRRK